MEDIQAIKELANEKIYDILEILGIQYKYKNFYLNGLCPVHKGNRKDAWCWHLNRGIWKCYSKGCDSEFGADIFGLIQGMKEIGFVQAKNWLKQHIDCNLSRVEIKRLKDNRVNKDFVNKTKKEKRKVKVYDPSCLSRLTQHPYLEQRGFCPQTIKKYGAGFCNGNKSLSNRIIFPIQDVAGQIIGFTGRTLNKDWEKLGIPKWKHSTNYDVSNNLFNIFHARQSINELGEAVLVEGPLDILRLEEAGVHNCVALLGKSLHNGQMNLLMKIPAFTLKFALDADTAGKAGTKKAVKLAKAFFDVKVIELPEGCDCGDLTVKEIRRLL